MSQVRLVLMQWDEISENHLNLKAKGGGTHDQQGRTRTTKTEGNVLTNGSVSSEVAVGLKMKIERCGVLQLWDGKKAETHARDMSRGTGMTTKGAGKKKRKEKKTLTWTTCSWVMKWMGKHGHFGSKKTRDESRAQHCSFEEVGGRMDMSKVDGMASWNWVGFVDVIVKSDSEPALTKLDRIEEHTTRASRLEAPFCVKSFLMFCHTPTFLYSFDSLHKALVDPRSFVVL